MYTNRFLWRERVGIRDGSFTHSHGPTEQMNAANHHVPDHVHSRQRKKKV